MLNEAYFQNINSTEKAYWLGFLFADGGISKSNTRLHVELSVKDENQLDRFINAINIDEEHKWQREGNMTRGTSVGIMIYNTTFVKHLVEKGCVYNKTKSIRFPADHLTTESLKKAFLMGYFDGDGKEHGCEIFSGSKKFLKEVKDHFGIDFEIKDSGSCWILNLGADLFKKMMEAYPQSMPRKRKTHTNGYLYDENMKQPNKSSNRPDQ